MPDKKPRPQPDELTARDDALPNLSAADRHIALLQPDDTVLQYKGGDYALYKETLRDDNCHSSFQQRRLAVTRCPWRVDAGAEDALSVSAAAWMREQLQSIEWDRIMGRMLYAVWYGHAVAEVLYQPDLVEGKVTIADIRVRDRARFAYANDGGPPFVWRAKGAKFVRLPERKMWTVNTGSDDDDSPYGLGLAHYCYWPVFFKRNNIKFWLIFLEKFGMPTGVVSMPAGQYKDVAMRNKVRDALQAMASEAGIIVPEGTTFEFAAAARSGTQDYDTMRQAMDNATSKIIIGQTASAQGTPGRLGNDELQSEVRLDLVKADSRTVNLSFVMTVAKWLTDWNFPGAATPWIVREVDPPEDMDKTAERDQRLYDMGYERTEESFIDTYGDGWQKRVERDTGLDPNAAIRRAMAEFAELGTVGALKTSRRADQQALVDAATAFANSYHTAVGKRIQQLIDYAETTDDYQTFTKRLRELLAEGAPEEVAEQIARGGIFARLMGRMRAQR